MNRLKWSDFEWFKKNSRVHVGDSYFKCSEVKGKDQKVIFPLKNLGKHLTFSISKRYLDLHITNDDRSIDPRSVMEIRTQKAEKIIRNSTRNLKPETFFIPINDKSLKKFILVDPYSIKFIKSAKRMNYSDLMPIALWKNKIPSMRNYHGKILSAYDCFGRFKGILKCDHEKNGFNFVPAKIVGNIQNKLVNADKIKRILLEEGLKEESKNTLVWKRWYKFIAFCENIHKCFNQVLFSISCFIRLKIR